jgi:hypothetical protein
MYVIESKGGTKQAMMSALNAAAFGAGILMLLGEWIPLVSRMSLPFRSLYYSNNFYKKEHVRCYYVPSLVKYNVSD